MAAPGMDRKQAQAMLAGRKGPPPHLRGGRFREIHCGKAAGGAGKLIHQAAGLSKIFGFGKAARLGNLHGRSFAAAEKDVKNGPDQALERSRGGKARARRQMGRNIGIKPGRRETRPG